MKTVYLSGGLRTEWRNDVIHNSNHLFLDPKNRGVDLNESEYPKWNIEAIKKSDIIFAYMEESNPSGIGLSFEVGLAKGMNKKVILCVEKNDRYFEYLKKLSDYVFSDFQEAISFLNKNDW